MTSIEISASKLANILRLGKSSTYQITLNDPLSPQVDNLLRHYLAREERSSSEFVFEIEENIRLVRECFEGNDHSTNEIIFARRTTMTLREFANVTEKLAMTPSRTNNADYLEMQMAMAKHSKTVCYYVVYSDIDKRFRDIVAVCINPPTIAYINSLQPRFRAL